MAPARVLVVDDEPLIAKLYARALSSLGFAVDIAHDGDSALERILATPPDLLVSDVNMPGLDGLQVLAWLGARRLKTFPVILLSGDDDVQVLMAGLAAGADDFIIKGMPFSALQRRAAFWLGGPFAGLPDSVRAAASATFLAMPEQRRPAARLHHVRDRIAARVGFVVADLLSATPLQFGQAEADVLRYLGVVAGVSHHACANDALAQLRLPDIWLQVTADVGAMRPALTRARLDPYFGNFGTHMQTPTFRHARDTLTVQF